MTSFQPLTNQLQVHLSKQRLRIIPSALSGLELNGTEGGSQKRYADNPIEEREFEVEVVNLSNRFASFEIELSTPGQPAIAANHWYDIEPKVCAKKPPGDRTTFRVAINRPPIPAINTTLDLAVHVFSVEYDDLETTHHLDLAIEQRPKYLQVHLISPHLKAYPGERLTIEALAMNLQSEPTDITLKLLRLDQDWFVQSAANGAEESNAAVTLRHTLPGGDTRRVAFHCIPPRHPITDSDVYEFDVEISDRSGEVCTAGGQVEVLPAGIVTFAGETRHQSIPVEGWNGGMSRRDTAIFPLAFKNLSNLTQQLHIQATEVNHHRCSIKPIAPVELLLGENQSLNLEVQRKQPWFGWERRLLIEVAPSLRYPESGAEIESIHLKPTTQTLEVRVRPFIPLWLQVGGGLLALLLTGWWWWLRPIVRHSAPITAVQIIGKESTVLTGSRDQTVYRWNVSSALGWFPHAPMLRPHGPLATTGELRRAVRVIRQSPRDAIQVAIGLENGAIELWNINQKERVRTIADRTDRVFALAFNAEARWLFSGHGSGRVRRWNVHETSQSEPNQTLSLANTAIADLEVLDYNDRSLLAIGGQFNRLVLWDWANYVAYTVDYQWHRNFQAPPVISAYHSLTEVEVSRDERLLVTADNRGFVTVWDGRAVMECAKSRAAQTSNITSNADTKVVSLLCSGRSLQRDQWQVTEDGVAVRAMALSEDGYYLATAADNGSIALWTINPETGMRLQPDPVPIESFRGYSPYEIDIKRSDRGHVLIAVDGPNNRPRLYHQSLGE